MREQKVLKYVKEIWNFNLLFRKFFKLQKAKKMADWQSSFILTNSLEKAKWQPQ